MKTAVIPLLGVALGLVGCTMIPKYERPGAPVPPAWPEDVVPATAAGADTPWQEFFTDQKLRRLIALALEGNRDLRMTALAIERAKAVHRISGSGLTPGVGVQAAGEKTRIPERMAEDKVAYDSEQYTVHVGTLSWELDIFGRIRSLKAAALEQYLATLEARRAAQVALVAAVAGTYLAAAADAENQAIARTTLESQESSLKLLRRSRDAGIASDLELHQVESQVETARAALAYWTGQLAVDRSALELLLGAPVPGELLPDHLGLVAEARALSPGLSSEVLLYRPDILAAEHRLKSANANIGAARAAFFPRISLTAALGTMSPEVSALFAAGTRTWTFAPLVTTPLWAGGSLRGGLKVAEVDRDIAVAEYEKAIQVAFAEVRDGLALRATLLEQRQAEEALVEALEATYRLSVARHEAGLDGYLGVLVAQRALFAGQQGLVGVRLAEQANVVTLYKAIGGGA